MPSVLCFVFSVLRSSVLCTIFTLAFIGIVVATVGFGNIVTVSFFLNCGYLTWWVNDECGTFVLCMGVPMVHTAQFHQIRGSLID